MRNNERIHLGESDSKSLFVVHSDCPVRAKCLNKFLAPNHTPPLPLTCHYIKEC